ncbi:MAG: DJ-1/PfpI family protein [Alphaproteobacteria bacterium]|nr:MAG: DJ-1/PfpI family protein [Alphaproteobacteria bacterium]
MPVDPAGECAFAGTRCTRRRRVAILLFDEVEVLDFAGPFEVFAVARTALGDAAFDVMTVALEPGEVATRNGLRVVPGATTGSLEATDILVIPGGPGTRREMTNPQMLEFVGTASCSAELTLSVCTGALLLGAAGLLAGRSATTHWAAMGELEALDSGATLLPGSRVVDNGSLVVCAGVSAGIDGALHVVERLLGRPQAEATALAMEYDWTGFDRDGRPLVTAAS